VVWEHGGASAYGTAAVAGFFVALEQPGPWGRNALRESHLGAELGGDLEERCAERGGRFVLLRRPGSHPDTGGPATVLVAYAGRPGVEAWLLRACLEDPRRLLDLDWEGLAMGDRDAVATSLPGAEDAPPALLVCTNGRRDVCCATRGRPVAQWAGAQFPHRVWESSHTGGHRFAPTGVLLPWGQTYARLHTELAASVLETSLTGRTPPAAIGPAHDRGRSPLPAVAQFAESSIRARLGEESLSALWAEPGDAAAGAAGSAAAGADTQDVVVRHRDGRRWAVTVSQESTGDSWPESCGKAAVPVLAYAARLVRELPAHHGLG
jgi:hypothetical protein